MPNINITEINTREITLNIELTPEELVRFVKEHIEDWTGADTSPKDSYKERYQNSKQAFMSLLEEI